MQTSAIGNDQQEVHEANNRMASNSTIGYSQTGNRAVDNAGTSQAATNMPEELHSPPPTQSTTRTSTEKQCVNIEREHDMATSGTNQDDAAQTATFFIQSQPVCISILNVEGIKSNAAYVSHLLQNSENTMVCLQ